MAEKKNLSFEEALGKLEASAESLKSDHIPLEEALRNFEAGIEYYNQCSTILNQAKQKIEIYSKE